MSEPQLPPEWEHELPSAAFVTTSPTLEPGTGPKAETEPDPWTQRRTNSRMRQALGAAKQAIGDDPQRVEPPSRPTRPHVVPEPVAEYPQRRSVETPPSFTRRADAGGATPGDGQPAADIPARAGGGAPAPALRPPTGPRPAPPKPAAPLIMDLRPGRQDGNGLPAQTQTAYGVGEQWGLSWEESAQGWIGADTPSPTWRPIIATTEELAEWEIETYLGVVTAEVGVEQRGNDLHRLGDTLARGRDLAHDGLLSEALNRGAHAVVGVSMQYTALGDRLLITLTGTAVTLRDRA